MNVRTLFAFALFFLLPLQGAAYTPKLSEVQDRIFMNYRSLNSWEVEARINQFPRLLFKHVQDGVKWKQAWLEEGEGNKPGKIISLTIGNGRYLQFMYPERRRVPQPFLNFWLPKSESFWETFSINTRVMGYRFFDDRPSLVIGAKYGDYSKPQLWVDNEYFVPQRLVYAGLDISWKDYSKVGNIWLPSICRILLNEREEYTLQLTWRSINKEFPKDTFNSQVFQTQYLAFDQFKRIPGVLGYYFKYFPESRFQR